MNLRIPGPTPVPPEVLSAMGRQMINHRGGEFAQLFGRVRAGLGYVFQTQNDILILVASGTGGLEAGIVNFLSPGDRILALNIGYFGERFSAIAQAHGAQVRELAFPWGEATDLDQVAQALGEEGPNLKAVLITHNETSTGVAQDLVALSRLVRERCPNALIIVDAISSLGALPLPTDEWGIDVVITCSQKALMTPPGLAMVSVSPRAWEAYRAARMSRFYMDLGKLKDSAASNTHPFTPTVSLFYALEAALKLIQTEGLPAVFERHRQIGQATRAKVKAMGLELLADPRYASDTITAIVVPEGISAEAVSKKLREAYGVVIASGQGKLRGKIWRIAHLGYVSWAEMEEALDALEEVLQSPSSPEGR